MTERPATDADYDALYQLHIESLREYITATYGWDESAQAKMFRDSWPANRVLQRVLFDDRSLIATWIVETRPTEIFLKLVEVQPSHQGRGIGSSLVERAIELAKADRLPLALTVFIVNLRAQALYRRLGFSRAGETPTHFRMVHSAV